MVRAESASIAKADPAQPELRTWAPGEKAVRGGQLVVIDLVGPSFNVNDDELAFVGRAHMGEDITIVDLVAAPRELFSGITGLGSCGSHDSSIRYRHSSSWGGEAEALGRSVDFQRFLAERSRSPHRIRLEEIEAETAEELARQREKTAS